MWARKTDTDRPDPEIQRIIDGILPLDDHNARQE